MRPKVKCSLLVTKQQLLPLFLDQSFTHYIKQHLKLSRNITDSTWPDFTELIIAFVDTRKETGMQIWARKNAMEILARMQWSKMNEAAEEFCCSNGGHELNRMKLERESV